MERKDLIHAAATIASALAAKEFERLGDRECMTEIARISVQLAQVIETEAISATMRDRR